MKIRNLLAVAGLCLPLAAHAIEANQVVKVTPVIKTTQSWDGQPLQYPQGQAEITGLIVEIAPGGDTGWHQHPVPSFGVLTQGELLVTLKDGRTKLLKTGDSLAEVVNTWHLGRTVGDVPAKILVFYAGAVGTPLTVKDAGHSH